MKQQLSAFSAGIVCVKFFTILSILLLFLPIRSAAQGNLLVTPRRIVFEGNKQSQEINIANTGQDTAVYSISFIQYRMKEDGTFEQIEEPDPGQMFADKYLRFFPRTVKLAPNESQTIRMQLRRTPDMVPGEYRSHLYFRSVPPERPLGEEELSNDTTTIGVRLIPIFGISIPTIIRIGDLKAEVNLNLSFRMVEDSIPTLNVIFNRKGEKSVYGDLIVEWQPDKGQKVEVGVVRGIAVYTPNTIRTFQMRLNKPAEVNYKTGKLIVRYVDGNDTSSEVFATAELHLGH